MKYLIVFILIAVPVLISAQTQVMGKVTLEGDSILTGVKVTLYKNGVNIIKTYTDKRGNYSFTIDPGTYDVSAEILGYNPTRIQRFIAFAGKVNYLNIHINIPGPGYNCSINPSSVYRLLPMFLTEDKISLPATSLFLE